MKVEGNSIFIEELNTPRVVSEFIRSVKEANTVSETIKIHFPREELSIFPNTIVPIYGVTAYFREKEKLNIEWVNVSETLQKIGLEQAYFFDSKLHSSYVYNKIWQFERTEEVFNLVSAFKEELYGIDTFGDQVLNSIEWCLNEVMDNVLNHSDLNGSSKGWVMGQIHQNQKKVAFCIFDYGIGIYNSLKDHEKAPQNPADALTLAIKQGITRDKTLGQGNGLWGLHSLIWMNKGRLAITSHGASYSLLEQNIKIFKNTEGLSEKYATTTVAFQISYEQPLKIQDALAIKDQQYKPVNAYLENLEDEKGRIVLRLSDEPGGYGTRKAASYLRHKILNLQAEHQGKMILDFDGVSIISSSYADELVAKLIVTMGIVQFANCFDLTGVNSIIQSLIQRAVAQRLAQSELNENIIIPEDEDKGEDQ